MKKFYDTNYIKGDIVLDRLINTIKTKKYLPNLSYCPWCCDNLSKKEERVFLDKLQKDFNFTLQSILENDYCCNDMKVLSLDNTSYIKYDPIFREFYLETNIKNKVIMLVYCPWCKTKLPLSLNKNFLYVLEKEYNIKTSYTEYKNVISLPKEFKTDEWWKKRGL